MLSVQNLRELRREAGRWREREEIFFSPSLPLLFLSDQSPPPWLLILFSLIFLFF